MGNWFDLAAVFCAGFVLAGVALRPGATWKRGAAAAAFVAALAFGRAGLLPALLVGAVAALAFVTLGKKRA